jgi:hypothetical protein
MASAPRFLLGIALDQVLDIIRQTAPFFGRRFPPPWSVEELDACFVVRPRAGRTGGAPKAKLPFALSRRRGLTPHAD